MDAARLRLFLWDIATVLVLQDTPELLLQTMHKFALVRQLNSKHGCAGKEFSINRAIGIKSPRTSLLFSLEKRAVLDVVDLFVVPLPFYLICHRSNPD